MATIWGPNNPTAAQTGSAAVNDVFVSISQLYQARRNSTPWSGNWELSWDVIVPPGTRGDVVPWDAAAPGQLNDRLAMIGARPWETGWANAADGVVGPPPAGRFTQETPLAVWNVGHQLGVRWVDVTVISPGDTDLDAEQSILVPKIEYVTAMVCRLTFADDVVGTAIIRR